ncbi:hypothetical protein KP509_21G033000 [Ceratopteris richardii]|nr:hypothetical protein KP509_21G033000 [Ceratopteris richardii]
MTGLRSAKKFDSSDQANEYTSNSKSQARDNKKLQDANTGNIESMEFRNQNSQATNMATRLLSEGTISSTQTSPVMNPLSPRDYSNLPRALLSSDQPLPPGHPCHGFTLPPPPADKKRTGPRPCPVCYLPLKETIKKMPTVFPGPSEVKHLSYKLETPDLLLPEEHAGSDFGGHPSLEERNKSYQVEENMNIYCGFVKGLKPGIGTGFDIDAEDLANMAMCRGIVVASAIFGNYDSLQQPANLSPYSRRSVCFYMFVDEETQQFMDKVNTYNSSSERMVWKVVVVRNMPYKDARRNGKIPKLLLHRLFPNARYSLWIDGKLQLVVDPYLVLERFLWRQNQTFAISQHYRRLDLFEEAEANKAAGKYDNASIDAQIEFYQREGIKHFNMSMSPFRSDVPEGCVIVREHSPISNLFTCLWFNEVDRFTSRDQLSFAIVRKKIVEQVSWRPNMFLDCERRNFVVQGYHKDILEQKALLHASLGNSEDTNNKVLGTRTGSSKEVLSKNRQSSLHKKVRKHKRGHVS